MTKKQKKTMSNKEYKSYAVILHKEGTSEILPRMLNKAGVIA